jgi:hypothetical protein
MNKLHYKYILFLLSLICFSRSIYAAAGSSGWTIFNRIQSSQFKALSVTSPGYSDLSGVLYNPAMAGTLSSRQLLFVSELGFTDDKIGAVLAGTPVGKGMISLGAGYYDAGAVELNWIENGGVMTQNVSLETDTLGLVSFEYPVLPNLYAGATLKGATSVIAQRSTASAYAGDVGLFYLPLPNLTLSLALQNYGSSTKFIDQANPLPTANYIGMGYVWKRGNFYLLTGADITNNIQDNEEFPEAGMEIGYNNISMNFGYSFNSVDQSNVHTGVQFVISNFTIGYAYSPGVYLGPTQSVTIGYKFLTTAPIVKADNKPQKQAAAAVPAPQPPRYQLRIPLDMAVAQFSVKGLPQSSASYIADSLREELIKIGKFDIVDRPDMERTLGTRYFKQPGSAIKDSAVEFGRLLNVKQAIIGSLSETEDEEGYYLKVDVVNIKTGKITHTFTKQTESLKLLRAACQGIAQKISDAWARDSKPPAPVINRSKKITSTNSNN